MKPTTTLAQTLTRIAMLEEALYQHSESDGAHWPYSFAPLVGERYLDLLNAKAVYLGWEAQQDQWLAEAEAQESARYGLL